MENKLPEGWEWKKLGDLTEKFVSGGTPPTKNESYWNGTIPWTTSARIDSRFIDSSEKYITEDAVKNSATNIVPKNNVLIATRVGIGKSAVNLIDLAISQDLTGVILNKSLILPAFLVIYLHSPKLRQNFELSARGSTIRGLTRSDVENIKVPLPPLETQQKIVAILEKAEETKKLRAQADELTQKLLQSVFLEMFGDPVKNPKNWGKKKLKEFGEIITGNTPSREKPEYYGNYVEWIKSDNINTPYTYLTRSEEMLSEKGAKVGRIAPINSVLVTCIAGSLSCIGNVAVADRNVAFNQQINAIMPNENVSTSFLYHLILNTKEYIQSHSTQSMKGMVSKGAFGSISFIMPPIESQMKFAEFSKRVEKMITSQNQSFLEINTLFDALMQKAFTGELVS